MGKLNKATVEVKYYDADKLPNVERFPNKVTFDFPASAIAPMLESNPEMPAIGVEKAISSSGGVTAIHPAKKYFPISNYMDTDTSIPPESRAKRKIVWWPVQFYKDNDPEGLLTSYFGVPEESPYKSIKDNAEKKLMDSSLASAKESWRTIAIERGVKQVEDIIKRGTKESDPSFVGPRPNTNGSNAVELKEDPTESYHQYCIEQRLSYKDMVWGAWCEPKLKQNVSFCLSYSPLQYSGEDLNGFFLMSMESFGEKIDLFFEERNKPKVVDWGNKNDQGLPKITEWTAAPNWDGGQLMISVVPIGHILNFEVNGNKYAFTRYKGTPTSEELNSPPKDSKAINDDFDEKPLKFKLDKLRVFGATCKATINLSAITFGAGAFGIGQVPDNRGKNQKSAQTIRGSKDGRAGDEASIAEVPVDKNRSNAASASGVMASKITIDGASKQINCEDKIHRDSCPSGQDNGEIVIAKTQIKNSPKDNKDTSTSLVATLVPGQTTFGSEDESDEPINAIAPLYFRTRGIIFEERSAAYAGAGADISEDLMSLTENFTTQDNAVVTHSVDLVLYNEGGKHNRFAKESRGITLSSEPFQFTGMTLDASTSETAGKETINIHCEDYMAITDHSVLMNSPFYDGMDSFDAVQDIMDRIGIECIDDSNDTVRYYIPSGFSYQEPRFRLKQDQPIKNGLTEIAKLGEKICYFDGEGKLHWDDLQGGLSFHLDTTPDFYFYSDPTGHRDEEVILETKTVEYMASSTVNEMFCFSIDRSSGRILVVHDVSQDSKIPYKKALFYDQPAFGSITALLTWMNMIKDRIYKVPRRITFKTISRKEIVPAKHFIEVDGQRFRVKTVSRTFNAEDNSLITTISAEWFGA